jgi:DNA-binding SARP family transcriptional activator
MEASVDGRPLAIGAGKRRALLAVLALHAGSTVSADRLIEGLWGERPPATAAKMVQQCVSQLRAMLAASEDDAEIVTRGRGYELRLGLDDVDARRFERLVAEGAPREALDLWRGPALDDLADEPFAAAEIRRLEELRLTAIELAIDGDLAAGRHRELVGELEALVTAEPLRERLHAQRMLALYRCGRQAEALAAYRAARAALVEQIGVEPGPELARLHEAILAHDPALEIAGPRRNGGRAELPTGVVTFLLTDIEGSSGLWERDANGMARALELHDQLITRAVEGNGGCLLKSKGEGDATLSVFQRASDAIAGATQLQAALEAAAWPMGLELKVRVAIHTGEAHEREGDYFGPALNRAARLRSIAGAGATLVSHATTEIVRDRLAEGIQLVDVGRHELRGLSRPERVFELRSSAATRSQGRVLDPARIRLPLPRPLQVATEFPFVGRDRELARLHGLWANATRGTRAVIVAGEPGIGKTRLAGELAHAVHNDGALVLYGQCDEGLAVPYQPFVEALRPYASAVGPDDLRAELDRLAPDLARLLPELDVVSEPLRADPETERYRLFEAVSTLVEVATRGQRALLVLDDLHWAAKPTLLMLRHLIRSGRRPGALVLGTYRENELMPDHPLAALVADLQRDASATRVRIVGLDERAIAALLEALAGHALDERAAELVRVLKDETGGNPFFIREVLAHLVESGRIYRGGDRWTTDLSPAQLEVPEELRHVIRHRVARLSDPARQALAVAAVAGPSFSLAPLEAVLGEQAGVLDGLDEAVATGLLAETGPGEYAFAHALVRQTLYDAHSAARRMRLHRQLGEALEPLADAGVHVEVLAHHFTHAAADGQAPKAAAYALVAGRHATARLAYEDAAAHLQRGLQALELAAAPDEGRQCELLLALAEACWSSGEMNRAREASRHAAELAERRGEPEQLARAALSFAGPMRFEVAAAVTQPLVDLLERALRALGDNESALRARALGRLAGALAHSAPERRRPALADQALEMAQRVGDRRALADVLATSYVATRGPDELDHRRARAEELARVAAEVGDGALAALASSWIHTDLLERGEIDQAEQERVVLDRLADTHQQRFPRFIAAMARARHAHLEGRLEDYEAVAHEALALGLEGQDETAAQAFGAQMLFLRREQGRLGELVKAIESFAGRYPEIPGWRCALAWVYAELERRPDARAALDVLARSDFSDLPRDWLWLMNIASLSEVVAFLNDADRAKRLYDPLLPYAERCLVIDAPFCQGSASRPLGLLATAMGRFDAAARHFEDAIAMNTKIRSPLWIAHTQHQYAHTLLRRDGPGDHEHARDLLKAAIGTADKLELNALADRARRLKYHADALASS